MPFSNETACQRSLLAGIRIKRWTELDHADRFALIDSGLLGGRRVKLKNSQSMIELILCIAVAYVHGYGTATFGQEPTAEVAIQIQ